MKCCNRMYRIASEIRKRVSFILQFKIRDPRVVGIVIVSGTDISKDLSYARIYVKFLNEEDFISIDQLNEKIKILRGASGFIRSLLARDMSLRVVPELFFIHDSSARDSMKIYRLLTQIDT